MEAFEAGMKGTIFDGSDPVFEVIGGILIGVTVHLCFPGIIALVAFDVEKSNFEGEAMEEIDDAALEIVFRSKIVIRITPWASRGVVDVFDGAFVITIEAILDGSAGLDLEETNVLVMEKQHDREHPVGLGTERARLEAEGRAFASPDNGAAD
jgi:hypothetical protein